jgi:uncharacterized ferritin-like protein (DUF455 family)
MTTLPDHLFAEGPARDARFDVRELWAEMLNLPADHPEQGLEFLHRQMNEEVNSIEMCARNLADFPDAPWELRMAMARQCYDEARHVEAFRALFEKREGKVGRYPIMNFQYRILMAIGSLIGRLSVQNRSFEAAGMDAIQDGLQASMRSSDPEFTALFDAQLADEVQHVRYANEWVRRLADSGGGRAVFELARAVAQANEALLIVSGGSIVTFPVDSDIRREAGFTDQEIDGARSMAAKFGKNL